jgi:flavin reductase
MRSEDLTADFKHAMRRLASTVAIVTSGRDSEWTGMVATAVTSVAADPPTLLVVVNRSASLSPVLAQSGHFCVNLLSQRHASIVGAFSGKKKGMERFVGGGWSACDEGFPVLEDAVASLVCKTVHALELATHTIFVGEVRDVHCHDEIDPLIWVDGHLARAESVSI